MFILCNVSHANDQTHRPAHYLTEPVTVNHCIRRLIPVPVVKSPFQVRELAQFIFAEIESHVDHDFFNLIRPAETSGGIQALSVLNGALT